MECWDSMRQENEGEDDLYQPLLVLNDAATRSITCYESMATTGSGKMSDQNVLPLYRRKDSIDHGSIEAEIVTNGYDWNYIYEEAM